jgi:predicted MPP superfamily phosphohydrolase
MGLFIGVMSSIMGGTHYYLWSRLVRAAALPAPFYGLATAVFVAFGVGMPMGLGTLGRMPWPAARLLLGVLYAWMGLVFFALWIRGGLDLLTWLVSSATAWRATPAQQLTLARGLSTLTAVLATSACLWAFYVTRRGPLIETVPVTLARLPPALHGFRLVQLSDLHVAPFLGADYVRMVVARTNALQPDAIVITGDLVDGKVADMGPTVALLAGLQAPQGVFFITGNHEYYSGADAWLEFVQSLGIRVLRNQRVALGRDGATFDLAGIDDWTAHHFGHGHGANLQRAVAGRDSQRELVLLAHQPRAIHEAAAHGVGLILCGHTHGGQMWPFGYIVRLVQPYLQGLHQHQGTQIYVNRGTGYWGPPLRLGAAPEITLLTLQAPQA